MSRLRFQEGLTLEQRALIIAAWDASTSASSFLPRVSEKTRREWILRYMELGLIGRFDLLAEADEAGSTLVRWAGHPTMDRAACESALAMLELAEQAASK